jgi:hypothetical protein
VQDSSDSLVVKLSVAVPNIVTSKYSSVICTLRMNQVTIQSQNLSFSLLQPNVSLNFVSSTGNQVVIHHV